MAVIEPTNQPTNQPTHFGLLVGLLVGLFVGGLVGWVVDERLQPRGVVYGVPPTYTLADHALGVNVDLTKIDVAARENFFRVAPSLGIRWLRQPIAWREIALTPKSTDWLKLDRAIEDSRARGFKILAVLKDSPDWTREPQRPMSAPPKDARAFGEFARAVASRYKNKIDAYQIWDEPNLSSGWGGQYPDAVAYATLLREGAINLRAADPHAKVISAALAPTSESGPLNLNEPEYLRQLYRAGARDFFDAVGAEPFGFWSGPDDRRVDVSVLNFSRVILLREVMQANGDGSKAIWATSFGWYVKGAADSSFGGDTAEQQSARTLDSIRRARDEWPWLGPLMFARWQPEGENDPRSGFALIRSDGSPSALLQRLQHNSAEPKLATAGRYAADSDSASYPQSWRVTSEGADIPQGDSTPLKITFRGTRFDLTLRRGVFEGFLFVRVDGEPANALPRDEQGRSYVALYDPLAQVTDITLARGLTDGVHTIEIVPQGGWGQWSLTGWVVARERETFMAWPLLGAAVGALLSSLIVMRPTHLTFHVSRFTFYVSRITPHVSRFTFYVSRFTSLTIFAAGALLYLSPNVLISWALILILGILIVWRLDVGLALVALAIPFYLQPKSLGVGAYSVVEIVVLLCALSFSVRWLMTQWNKKQPTGEKVAITLSPCHPSASSGQALVTLSRAKHVTRHSSPFDFLVILWLIAGGVGVLNAQLFGVANREFRVVFIEPALYYFMLSRSRSDVSRVGRACGAPHTRPAAGATRDVWPIVNAFIAGAVVISLKGLADWLTQTDLITAEGVLRVRSVYFSPNNLALYLDRVAPLILSLALYGQTRRPLYLGAFVVVMAALYLTFAKGAWLLALPAAFIFILFMRGLQTPVFWRSTLEAQRSGAEHTGFSASPRKRVSGWLPVAVASLVVLVALSLSVLPVLGTERLRSVFDFTAGTTFIRVQLWQSAIQMIREHPIFGVGLDQFLYQYRTRYILPSAFVEANLSHPHNILLDFWTRLGLLGVALLFLLLVLFWRRALALYRRQLEGDERALTLGLMASMLAALAHGLIDNSFFLVDLAFVLMLTLGIVKRET